jgi:tight adherence protein C
MPIFTILIIGAIVAVVALALVLVIVGVGAPNPQETLEQRLAEYGARETPVSLEEIELSLPFSQRVIVPVLNTVAQFVARFTPQRSLESARHSLELAGNPYNLTASQFWAARAGVAVVLGFLIGLVIVVTKQDWTRLVLYPLLAAALGFFLPVIWLSSQVSRRKNSIIKSLPDALDLLTVCVEAGLGFDGAMQKVTEKWKDDLALAFARVLQEVRLGKTRREALRDMSDRMEVTDVTSFVAAIIQADQLGVSIAKVLRIQSDQMRVRRRQRAEEKAHQAPVKMLFPMVFLIFPSIYIILLGPAVLMIVSGGAKGLF